MEELARGRGTDTRMAGEVGYKSFNRRFSWLAHPYKPYGFRGWKATLNQNISASELRSCVKVEVTVLGSRP